MSTELTKKRSGAISKFVPEKARETKIIRDARIELAARLGNTEALETEIDKKLDDQEDAVQWWRATVRPSNRPKKTSTDSVLLFQEQAEKIIGFNHVTISRWAKKLADREEYREEISRAARRKMQLEAEENHRAQGTGENEWWTPSGYIEAARAVLGEIDLDPATTRKANDVVKAAQIFTKADNGLKQPWHGRVWLNPPYAQPLIGQFVEKLCTEFSERRTEAAVLLTHNYTDTAWFHLAEKHAARLCFTRGRIAFLNPKGEPAAPTQGQAFFYFGDKDDDFRANFARFGFIR